MTTDYLVPLFLAATTISLALIRVIPSIAGSITLRQNLVVLSAFSFLALIVSGALEFVGRALPNAQLASWRDLVLVLWFGIFIHYFGLGVLLRLYVRTTRFKDYGTWRNLRAIPLMKLCRSIWKKIKKDRETYETSTVLSSESMKVRDKFVRSALGNDAVDRQIILLTADNPWLLRRRVIQLAVDLALKAAHDVNYVSCTLPASIVWDLFEEAIKEDRIEDFKSQLVLIDAYTDSFGFRDEVLIEGHRSLTVDKNVNVVKDATSAASVHAASSEAFHILKRIAKKKNRSGRRPCVMIYDSLSMMGNADASFEIAQFVVHLTAAELAYEMFPILIEPNVENRDSVVLDSLRACCGSAIDLSEADNNENS